MSTFVIGKGDPPVLAKGWACPCVADYKPREGETVVIPAERVDALIEALTWYAEELNGRVAKNALDAYSDAAVL